MRLLGYIARARGAAPPGANVKPDQEIVRFRAAPSLSFPTSSLATVKNGAAADTAGPFDVAVAFLGMAGPSGALPYHYTRLVLERVRARDYSLRDFLDLFNHRLVTLFHQAWEKYRLPFTFERVRLGAASADPDPISQVLYSLAGFGTAGLRGRLEVADLAFVYYAGHFSHYPRTALALEGMLTEYFELPAEVRQLQGQWLYLEPDDCSQMPEPGRPEGRNARLGLGLLAGARVWDIQSRFRLRLGPLGYEQFRRLLPPGDMLRPVAQLTRTYAGPELDCDVQLVLKPDEVPWCQLGDEALLGWNTWVRCGEFDTAVADTVFLVED